ncbi:MAG: hypothetical protein LBL60_00580 [Mycoplasmataceae bacterium]|jgi:hypothetical protein|nr:hypothetical protein [Mycoplasmataceae bacterium]
MSFWVLGFVILLLILMGVYATIHPKIKSFMNKWYFWTCISIPWFIYSLYLYIDYVWINGINVIGKPGGLNVGDYGYWTIYGDATFTAICNFIKSFLPLMLIFNPTRKIAKNFMVVGWFTGFVTLIQYLPDREFNSFSMCTIGYFGSIFQHFLLGLICFMGLFNISFTKFNKKEWWKSEQFLIAYIYIGYALYIIIICYLNTLWVPKCHWFINSTGFFKVDYSVHGQWSVFNALYSLYPLPLFLIIIVAIGAIVGSYWIVKWINKNPKYAYKEPKYFYLKKYKAPHKWWQW